MFLIIAISSGKHRSKELKKNTSRVTFYDFTLDNNAVHQIIIQYAIYRKSKKSVSNIGLYLAQGDQERLEWWSDGKGAGRLRKKGRITFFICEDNCLTTPEVGDMLGISKSILSTLSMTFRVLHLFRNIFYTWMEWHVRCFYIAGDVLRKNECDVKQAS